MNGKDYIYGLAFYTDIGCSSLKALEAYLKKIPKEINFNKKEVIQFLDEEIKKRTKAHKTLTQKVALDLLIVEDFKKLKKTAEKIEILNPINNIPKVRKTFLNELARLGLKTVEHKIEIAEHFPSIWRGCENTYVAIGLGPGYIKLYNIEPGIYFSKKLLSPIYSDYQTLIHETIHQVINYYSDTEFGRGLEEGLCDVFGEYYLGSKLVAFNVLRKSYIYRFY